LRRALAAPGAEAPTAARAKALHGVWELAVLGAGGTGGEAWRAAEESLAICQEIGDRVGAAWSMNMIGRQYRILEDYQRAEVTLEPALNLARQESAHWVTAQVLEGLGMLAARRDDVLTSQRYFEESLTLFRDLG